MFCRLYYKVSLYFHLEYYFNDIDVRSIITPRITHRNKINAALRNKKRRKKNSKKRRIFEWFGYRKPTSTEVITLFINLLRIKITSLAETMKVLVNYTKSIKLCKTATNEKIGFSSTLSYHLYELQCSYDVATSFQL